MIESQLQPGDILAFYGRDLASQAISVMTSSMFGPSSLRWPPSHVGIVIPDDRTPLQHFLLIESTQMCDVPCQILGKQVNGVQAHSPTYRVMDYCRSGGHVDVYRLAGINKIGPGEIAELRYWLIEYYLKQQRTPYDYRGAVLSGTRLLQRMGYLFPKADLHSLFCSELIASVLQRCGLMNMSNPARFNPGRLLRELVWSGVYDRELSFVNKAHTCCLAHWPASLSSRRVRLSA